MNILSVLSSFTILVGQVGAIYYEEYFHRYDDGAGRIGNCAFGGTSGEAFASTLQLDPYDYGSTQHLTAIKPIEMYHECVTTIPGECSGKDVFQKYNNGIPYFNQSATHQLWPSYYVGDVVGECSSPSLDFYAVSACADWNDDGSQDKFLLLQEGEHFTQRDEDYENGGVEKFTPDSLGDIFSIEWDSDLGGPVLAATIPSGGLTSVQSQQLNKLDKAAIVINLSCDVEPQPFTFAKDGDEAWKKYPVAESDLPANWPSMLTVDHCMTFVLDILDFTYQCPEEQTSQTGTFSISIETGNYTGTEAAAGFTETTPEFTPQVDPMTFQEARSDSSCQQNDMQYLGSEYGSNCGTEGVGLLASSPTKLSELDVDTKLTMPLEDMFYDIQPSDDGSVVSFQLQNPFPHRLDTYVQYEELLEGGTLGRTRINTCLGTPNVDQCDSFDTGVIEAVCIGEKYAMVTVYFVDDNGGGSSSFFGIEESATVDQCCHATGSDKAGIVSYTFYITCTCSSEGNDNDNETVPEVRHLRRMN